MKLTASLRRGSKTKWIVKSGSAVVAEINHELTGGVVLQYRPYLHMTDKPGPDGESYYLRQLAAKNTLAEAVEVISLAIEPPVVAADVADRVTFIGVGMTQDKANKFAAGIRKRMDKPAR